MPNATDTIEQSQSKHLQQSFREKQKNRKTEQTEQTEQTGTITFKHGDLLLRPIQLFHARCRPALLKGGHRETNVAYKCRDKDNVGRGRKKKMLSGKIENVVGKK
jgi:hypothetical protein